MVEPAPTKDVDFGYRIFNADGSEVEQCGNGARCLAAFVRNKGLSQHNPLRVATQSGVIELLLSDDGLVQVNMGVPKTEPKDIPFTASGKDRKSTRLNSSHVRISYAVFCLKKKKNKNCNDYTI